MATPRKRFRRFRFRLRFREKRFRQFRFPVPVRFLSHSVFFYYVNLLGLSPKKTLKDVQDPCGCSKILCRTLGGIPGIFGIPPESPSCIGQDKFDHVKGQKSAISGCRLHWRLSTGFFAFSPVFTCNLVRRTP